MAAQVQLSQTHCFAIKGKTFRFQSCFNCNSFSIRGLKCEKPQTDVMCFACCCEIKFDSEHLLALSADINVFFSIWKPVANILKLC